MNSTSPTSLELDDGTTIVGLSRPRQGMRHRVLFGIEEPSGREVAVKIELVPDSLETERRALEWLGSHSGPAPRLLAAGTLATSDLAGALCLVCDRAAGEAPSSTSGWTRLGEALARLAQLPWRGSGLAIRDHRDFVEAHEARVSDLSEELGFDLGGRLPALPSSYPGSSLSLTHGDPGPGNFLDDGGSGALIDWEDAHVAPRGLDLGRASSIALLGAGPEGYAPRDQQTRADAVVAGYAAQSEDWSPGEAESAWWMAVAAVQLAHRRLERAGEPGVLPWRDALAILDGALDPG